MYDKTVIDRITSLPFIEKLNYKQNVNVKTGQIFTSYNFDLDGIIFYWDDFKLSISIKPHYYFNQNKHNANDFSPLDCIKTLNGIVHRLQLENVLNQLKIVSIEYGVNFTTSQNGIDIVNSLYFHGTNIFYNVKDLAYCKVSYKPRPDGKANKHKQYKFYSKGIQFPLCCDANTLRAEVRSNRSKFINSLGIYDFSQLLKVDTYNVLKNSFLKETSQLLFISNLNNVRVLTSQQKARVKTMNNPKYWQKLLENNRVKFTRKKTQYLNVLNKTGYNLTNSVITSITDKTNALFDDKSGSTSTRVTSKKSGLTSTFSISRTHTTFKKCLVTGVNISMQKCESNLLSNTGLKYLEQNDYNEFLRLKNIFLTGNLNKFETDVYSMISKQIRNRYNNNKHQYNVMQTHLFAS